MQTCGQIMTKNPSCCVASDTADKAAKLMKMQNVGSIPIVDNPQSQKLVGIVTDRDLALKVIAENREAASIRLEQIMTRNPIVCRESDDVQKALDAMSQRQIRRIPIVDNNDRLIGIIAQADIAMRHENPRMTAEVVEEISKPAKVTTH